MPNNLSANISPTTESGFNIGIMRPFVDRNKKTGEIGVYAAVFKGGDPKDGKNWGVTKLQTNALTVNNTLRRDEWIQLDQAIANVARDRLQAIQDLRDNNLTFNLPNAMGTTVLEWHNKKSAMNAAVDMNANTRTQNDTTPYQHNFTPIPIIHSDYQIDMRHLEASRRLGNNINTDNAEEASRTVNEQLEDMLVTDFSFSFGATDDKGRNSIYSYIAHPDRLTRGFGTNGQWDATSKTAENIKDDVLDMIQDSVDNGFHGPWMLYVPRPYQKILDDDYKGTSAGMSQTIRQRIESIDGIQGVKVIDRLPNDNVVLVEMNTRTVRLVDGVALQNVNWETNGGFVQNFKVWTIQVPQIRSIWSDVVSSNVTGVVHMS